MKLLYFSWIREKVGRDEEDIDLPADVNTVAELFDWQAGRGEEFGLFAEQPDIIRVALDREHAAKHDASLSGVSEIAIFPPMTGG
jgi:molybdopterin synthase sulfur carrier subunit